MVNDETVLHFHEPVKKRRGIYFVQTVGSPKRIHHEWISS